MGASTSRKATHRHKDKPKATRTRRASKVVSVELHGGDQERADLGERTERAAGEALRRQATKGERKPKVKRRQLVIGTFVGDAGASFWRIRHRNGNIVADGSEGYARRAAARKAARRLVTLILDGDYEWVGLDH